LNRPLAKGAAAHANRHPDHVRGLVLCVAGIVLISPDALIIRAVEANAWSTLFWRGAFATAGIAALIAMLGRIGGAGWGAPRGATWRALLLGAVLFAGATISFVTALHRTEAANVLVIIAAGPVFAAAFERAVLREPVPLRTWVTTVAVLVGVAWTISGSLRRGDLDGDAVALVGSICFAGYLVAARGARPADLTPAIGIGAAASAAVALMTGDVLRPSPADLVLLAGLGLVILPVSLALTTRATRYLPAAEVSLVSLLETVLGPLWVWLALGEVPSSEVLAGGALILGAVTVHSALALREGGIGQTGGLP